MSFIEKRKRRRGDRADGHRVRDIPGINVIMSGLYPNRCDCEVCLQKDLDVTNLLKFIEEKNKANNNFGDKKLKLFHCIVAMYTRLCNDRRSFNRFVRNLRIYERDEISISFVAKRHFADGAQECLLTYVAKGNHTVDDVSKFIVGEVGDVRKEDKSGKKNLDDTIEKAAKLPKPILSIICGLARLLDKHGKMPASLRHGDPAYSTVLLSNLGSIKCPAVYHHLNNYGTNSFMTTIGCLHKGEVLNEDGTKSVRDLLDISMTLDERIADGFYFARSLKVLDYIASHPEVLDKPFSEEINYDF